MLRSAEFYKAETLSIMATACDAALSDFLAQHKSAKANTVDAARRMIAMRVMSAVGDGERDDERLKLIALDTAVRGKCILVIEDEAMVALDLMDCLQEHGAQVLLADTLETAIELAERSELAAAVVDFELHGANGTAICNRLSERGVPFAFYTGRPSAELRRWPKAPALAKPCSCAEIVGTLNCLLRSHVKGQGEGA